MSPENGLALHVLEAEFADVEATQTCVLLRIGRVVPGVQLVAAEQDGLDHVAALGDLTLDTQLLLQEGRQKGIQSVTAGLNDKVILVYKILTLMGDKKQPITRSSDARAWAFLKSSRSYSLVMFSSRGSLVLLCVCRCSCGPDGRRRNED